MTNTSEKTPVIFIPWMHADLLPEGTPEGVRCFDPGLARFTNADVEKYFVSSALPLGPSQARAYLVDMLDFASRFKSPGVMKHYATQGVDDHYTNTGLDMNSELGGIANLEATLDAYGNDAGPATEKPADTGMSDEERCARSQNFLLLAWSLEERLLELAQLKDGLVGAFEKMGEAMGVDRNEKDMEAMAPALEGFTGVFSHDTDEAYGVEWKQMCEHVLLFLPEGTTLFVSDAEIRADLQEQGVEFTPVPEAQGKDLFADMAGTLERAVAPAWSILGYNAAPEDKVWMEKSFSVLFWHKAHA